MNYYNARYDTTKEDFNSDYKGADKIPREAGQNRCHRKKMKRKATVKENQQKLLKRVPNNKSWIRYDSLKPIRVESQSTTQRNVWQSEG